MHLPAKPSKFPLKEIKKKKKKNKTESTTDERGRFNRSIYTRRLYSREEHTNPKRYSKIEQKKREIYYSFLLLLLLLLLLLSHQHQTRTNENGFKSQDTQKESAKAKQPY
jgi:hypothetical protein